jgi:hypothetical protein
MISPWFSLILPLLGAVLFRIRGGWLNLGSSTGGRAVWAVGMTIIPALITWKLAVLAPALFAGAVLGWWKSIDMGRNEGSWIQDAVLQEARGILWVLPAAAAAAWALGWWAVAVGISGVLCAPAYELGWRTPSTARNFTRGSELGELYFGACIGIGLAVAILGGSP